MSDRFRVFATFHCDYPNVRYQYKPVVRDNKLAWYSFIYIANDSFTALADIQLKLHLNGRAAIFGKRNKKASSKVDG